MLSEKKRNNKENKLTAETRRAQREVELNTAGTNIIPKHKKQIYLSTYFNTYIEEYTKKDIRMIKLGLSWFNKFLE